MEFTVTLERSNDIFFSFEDGECEPIEMNEDASAVVFLSMTNK